MLDDKISAYLDVLTKAAMKAGPQVMQFAISHEYWCGVGDLAIGFFFLVLALGLAIWLKTGKSYLFPKDSYEAPAGLLVGGASLVTFVIASIQLLNIWNWVAVFNPRIALFHDILEKFLSH